MTCSPSAPVPSVVSASVALRLLTDTSSHRPLLVDARSPGLYRLEHVRGAVSSPPCLSTAASSRAVLVYDSGTETLNGAVTRAVEAVRAIHTRLRSARSLVPVHLLSGGLPALLAVAPYMVSRQCPWMTDDPPARILPHLFVGSVAHALDAKWLCKHRVRFVLSVGDEFSSVDYTTALPKGTVWSVLNVRDEPGHCLRPHLNRVIAFIDAARARRAACVVHCMAGASRSVAAVAAYLIHYGWAARDALAHIAAQRPAACPNAGFVQQLREWEVECATNSPVIVTDFGTNVPPVEGLFTFNEEHDATCWTSAATNSLPPSSPLQHAGMQGAFNPLQMQAIDQDYCLNSLKLDHARAEIPSPRRLLDADFDSTDCERGSGDRHNVSPPQLESR